MRCSREMTLAPRWGWARRLRLVAAAVTITAGIPGVLATITIVVRPLSPEHASPTPKVSTSPRTHLAPGPGRCPAYHAFRDGRCRDVRE
jgi:hypothetical protein